MEIVLTMEVMKQLVKHVEEYGQHYIILMKQCCVVRMAAEGDILDVTNPSQRSLHNNKGVREL